MLNSHYFKHGSIVLLLCSILCLPGCGDGDDGPSLVFEKTNWNFGSVEENTITICEFVFWNKGKSPLVIEDVLTSCGCLDTKYPKNEILPGASGSIRLGVEFREDFMSQIITAIVVSNDPKNPSTELTVIGHILPHLLVNLEEVHFKEAMPGRNLSKEFEVLIPLDYSCEEEDCLVFETSSPSLQVDVMGRETRRVGSVWLDIFLCQLLFEAPNRIGKFEESLKIKTLHASKSITATCSVSGYVDIRPQRLLFNNNNHDVSLPQNLTASSLKGENFIIYEISPSCENIHISANQETKGVYNISVSLRLGNINSKVFNETITLRTNDEFEPVINIPVNGWL